MRYFVVLCMLCVYPPAEHYKPVKYDEIKSLSHHYVLGRRVLDVYTKQGKAYRYYDADYMQGEDGNAYLLSLLGENYYRRQPEFDRCMPRSVELTLPVKD